MALMATSDVVLWRR